MITINKNHIQLLIKILEKLDELPYSSKIVVFGSMARSSDSPGDIDLVVRCDDIDYSYVHVKGSISQTAEFRALIQCARLHYGLVDPFISFQNVLLVRNDEATGWKSARGARGLLKSIKEEGKPLAQVLDDYRSKIEPRPITRIEHDAVSMF